MASSFVNCLKNGSGQTATKDAAKKNILLVVGDTFIDENWLMSRFESYHSYNVGDQHYISMLKDAASSIISLCGVGGVIKLLQGYDDEHKPEVFASDITLLPKKWEMVGVTALNPDDTRFLQCLLCSKSKHHTDTPNQPSFINPYRLLGFMIPPSDGNGSACPYTNTPCNYKFNLINIVKNDTAIQNKTSTNRLIRVYEGFGSDQARLSYRFDWRLDLKDEHKDIDEVNKQLENIEKNIDKVAIVIVDHDYKVIDEKLIDCLYNKFGEKAEWYIRCKIGSPKWLQYLCEKTTPKLIFTDEQLVNHEYGKRIWRHENSVLGRGSLEVLGDLLGLVTFEHTKPTEGRKKIKSKNAIVLFEDDTVIAGSRTGDEKNNEADIIDVAMTSKDKKSILVGRSTVFFSSVVYWDLMQENDKRLNTNTLSTACKWALDNVSNWTAYCTKAWLSEEPESLSGPFESSIYTNSFPTPCSETTIRQPYSVQWKNWNDSSEGLGIITVEKDNQKEKEIHLWRAQGTLKNFICPGGKKRSDINELINRLALYQKDKRPKHPFNCLLLAEPGWGKSYLAQSLSSLFEFEYIDFSIAQMTSNKDLVDSLKMISSTQNRTKKTVLVFMDEIDAQIENHNALGLLLGPIWGGTFKSDGNIYKISPCIWVFASSSSRQHLKMGPKGKDFLSRINGPIVILDFFSDDDREEFEKNRTNKDLLVDNAIIKQAANKKTEGDELGNEALRTEMVYHGVNFLNSMFGPITSISQSVLQIFHDLFPMDGIRSLEIFVSRFKDISKGKVSLCNVPTFEAYPELERHIMKLEPWWENLKSEKLKTIEKDRGYVKVKVNPSK